MRARRRGPRRAPTHRTGRPSRSPRPGALCTPPGRAQSRCGAGSKRSTASSPRTRSPRCGRPSATIVDALKSFSACARSAGVHMVVSPTHEGRTARMRRGGGGAIGAGIIGRWSPDPGTPRRSPRGVRRRVRGGIQVPGRTPRSFRTLDVGEERPEAFAERIGEIHHPGAIAQEERVVLLAHAPVDPAPVHGVPGRAGSAELPADELHPEREGPVRTGEPGVNLAARRAVEVEGAAREPFEVGPQGQREAQVGERIAEHGAPAGGRRQAHLERAGSPRERRGERRRRAASRAIAR